MRRFSDSLRGFSEYHASAWALVAANALPLLGVVFLGWDAFAIIALYWVENVIIGAINVLKMITCSPDPSEIKTAWAESAVRVAPEDLREAVHELKTHGAKAQLAHHGSKLFFTPFFIFHYGGFCVVHGAFVFAVFAPDSFGGSPFHVWKGLVSIATERHLGWAVAALAGSHLYSFFRNYLGRGEYRRTVTPWLMVQPYARVVVLHIARLLGAFVVVALGSNVGVLAVLVIGKTLLDLVLHLHERERNAAKPKPIMPDEILAETPAI